MSSDSCIRISRERLTLHHCVGWYVGSIEGQFSFCPSGSPDSPISLNCNQMFTCRGLCYLLKYELYTYLLRRAFVERCGAATFALLFEISFALSLLGRRFLFMLLLLLILHFSVKVRFQQGRIQALGSVNSEINKRALLRSINNHVRLIKWRH